MGMWRERECGCLELEERVSELEPKMQKRDKEFESLELEKLIVEKELMNLKDSRRVEEDEDSLIEQMMVNKALECEKQVAEKEAQDWKCKFEKLVEAVRKLEEKGAFRGVGWELDENLKSGLELARINLPERLLGNETKFCRVSAEAFSREGLVYQQTSDLPYITTPVQEYNLGRRRDNVAPRRPVNKMLLFEDDSDKSTSVVDLCDSKEKPVNVSNKSEPELGSDVYEDEDVEVNTSTPLSGHKRKRVITSDSENDDEDDNIPISILKNLKPTKEEMSDIPTTEESWNGRLRSQHRVLSRLRKQRVPQEIAKEHVGIPTSSNAEDDEAEEESEAGSESESLSLDGFIVDDDDDDDVESNEAASDETGEEEESDGETGYADVISRLRRDKKPGKQKWEYEADMLADFGKDPELCMKAVCGLYRFQTEDEKAARWSHVSNGRGFSKLDAKRGSRIGYFLTDGDSKSDLKKSVEELKSFESDGVEICRCLAERYSKQLFQIYKNREDLFFAAPPSP